jgi:C-terminal processing protease CtpA/Prc
VNLPNNAPKFELKRINAEVQYLAVRTFQANRQSMQKSKEFYESIKNQLTAPNLILDLRNNEGGAEKESQKYLKLLQRYTRSGKLYVLLNNGTLSQAEILTLQLKKLKNTTTVGQTTRGMLSYGSNYDKREKLPSGEFEVYVTDMKGKKEYLKYEDYGIEPDIALTDKIDWIDQVIEVIQRK